MNSALFRKQAITTYVDTDVRGAVLQVVPPRLSLIYLVVLAAVVLGAVLVLGSEVPVSAHGVGVLRPSEGVRVLRSPQSGAVAEVAVRPGARVEAGALLFRVKSPSAACAPPAPAPASMPAAASGAASASAPVQPPEAERPYEVVAPVAATVDEVWVQPGSYIQAGETAAVLVPSGPLVGYMAVAEVHRGGLRPGALVRVVYGHAGGQQGETEGRVQRVSSELLSERWEQELRRAGAEPQGPSVLVEVAFNAPAEGFASGTRFSGQVLMQRRRVASLLLQGP